MLIKNLLYRWRLGMDELIHPTLYNGCNYSSMVSLKLIHLSKRGPSQIWINLRIYTIWHPQKGYLGTFCNFCCWKQTPGVYTRLTKGIRILFGIIIFPDPPNANIFHFKQCCLIGEYEFEVLNRQRNIPISGAMRIRDTNFVISAPVDASSANNAWPSAGIILAIHVWSLTLFASFWLSMISFNLLSIGCYH